MPEASAAAGRPARFQDNLLYLTKMQVIDILNKDLPVAKVIKQALADCSASQRVDVLGNMTEEEFIDHRVNIFLEALETALHERFHPAGAEEIAYQECMSGLIPTELKTE